MTDKLVERLRDSRTLPPGCVGVSGNDAKEAADRIQSLTAALNAIIDRGPERDIKWAGMTARDIALAALSQTGGE